MAPQPTGMPTAYRVETARLVLRCWSPEDAPALRAVLEESDHHLRPWIPFMKDEPRTLKQTADWLREQRANFDLDRQFRYAVFERSDHTVLGENMLLARVGPGALEIGYWTAVAATGRGIATEATCAVIRIGFELAGAERLEIHCAPENETSAAIPAKLGFKHEATLGERARDIDGRVHDLMVWTLFAADYPGSPARARETAAFDCLGRPLRVENA
jgi:RimJ/RimL family protein N-acetyltransferase